MGIFGGLAGGVLGRVESEVLPGLLSKALAQTNLGSLQGLLDKLRQSGLGPQVASWLGTGPNQPITPEQLEAALGDGEVEKICATLNMPPDEVFGFLAKHLPAAVDALSPNGTIQPS